MSDIRFELRRDPPRDPDAVGQDDALVAMIRAEIAERGPMTFARFMELALYEPDHGYYRRAQPGPGTGGDFLTAPETHPIFGAAVARVLHQTWAAMGGPATFVVAEHGAGTGALALAILEGLRRDASALADAIRYRPIDIEPARVEALERRLEAAGLAAALEARATAQPSAPPDVVLANEVLDALPVHRVALRDRLRERYVARAGDGLVEVEGEPSTPALALHLEDDGVALGPGQVTEVPLAADGWLAAATGDLRRGLVLLVDYGADAADLHGPWRPQGSLRSFARHVMGDDPFVRIGRQDLTSHVCLTGLRRAATRLGLTAVAATTQAELLAAAGMGDLVGRTFAAPAASLEAALTLRSALARLLDPRIMGGYHVLAFGRGLPDGFAPAALQRVAPPHAR